jgi:predicted AlkP superfamily pyrophosphatase or phosphodiesterase
MIRGLLPLLFVVSSLGAQGSGGVNVPAQQNKPYVILISFDGMKPEYLERIELPNFQRVMRAGVRSTGMIPTFPSKTFPNHYTIVTGWHAGRHGLVGNSFWDPERNAGYRMADSIAVRDSSWYRGEPIWTTAEKQGMVAASFFWPGSEAAIGGARPSLVKAYDGRMPNLARVDSVLGWLQRPATGHPHMITMYFSTVDGAGHEHGPLSPQVDSAAWAVDSALGRLVDGIERLPIKDRVYLVLVSDHGMSETSPRWFAALDTLIDTTGVFAYDAGPNVNLHVRGGAERARVLRDSINRRMRHGRAYLRGDVPARYHYDADPRIGDVVVIMDEHFTIGRSSRPPKEGTATHGWDPALESMHAIFVASGPGIPAGKTIPSFENVDVYPWLTELLALRPASGTDGQRGRLARLIRSAR